MDAEQILLKQIDRAGKAERLLNDELLIEAFTLVEAHIMNMFKSAPLRDEEGIVKVKYMLHLLGLVKGALEQAVKAGELATHALEEKRRGVTWLGDVWRSRQSRR